VPDASGAGKAPYYFQLWTTELQSMRRVINRHGGRLGPARVINRRNQGRKIAWRNDQA
jgi:hypothetical protein